MAVEARASVEDKKNARILLCDATTSLGLIEESTNVLEKMIQENFYDNKTRTDIYEKLIRLYDRNKEFTKAANTRLKLIEYNKIENDEAASLLLQSAINYQSEGQYKESEESLELALKKVKDSVLKAEILYYKAYAKTISEEYELAYVQLTEALKSNSIQGDLKGQIYYLLGEIYEWRQDYSTALTYYEKALDLYPNKIFVQKRIDFVLKTYIGFADNDKKK